MPKPNRRTRLLTLFTGMTSKTRIVEPMSTLHGMLRDNDVIEREIALIVREILEQDLFRTRLRPLQVAQLITRFHAGKTDTEIARDLGSERLAKTVARTRVRLRLLREQDLRMPFDRGIMEKLLVSGKPMTAVSRELGISPSTLREYRHVIDERRNPAIDPYLVRIRDVLEDRDISGEMLRNTGGNISGIPGDMPGVELAEIS